MTLPRLTWTPRELATTTPSSKSPKIPTTLTPTLSIPPHRRVPTRSPARSIFAHHHSRTPRHLPAAPLGHRAASATLPTRHQAPPRALRPPIASRPALVLRSSVTRPLAKSKFALQTRASKRRRRLTSVGAVSTATMCKRTTGDQT